MILNDLTLSANATSEQVKTAIEEKLSSFLPKGSYTVILRSYQGDFRARSTSQAQYKAMFLLDAAGRQAALEHKSEMETLGFRVAANGDIQLN